MGGVTATPIPGADILIGNGRLTSYEAILTATTGAVVVNHTTPPDTVAYIAHTTDPAKTAGTPVTDLGVAGQVDLDYTAAGGEDLIGAVVNNNGLAWGAWVGMGTTTFADDLRSNEFASSAIALKRLGRSEHHQHNRPRCIRLRRSSRSI